MLGGAARHHAARLQSGFSLGEEPDSPPLAARSAPATHCGPGVPPTDQPLARLALVCCTDLSPCGTFPPFPPQHGPLAPQSMRSINAIRSSWKWPEHLCLGQPCILQLLAGYVGERLGVDVLLPMQHFHLAKIGHWPTQMWGCVSLDAADPSPPHANLFGSKYGLRERALSSHPLCSALDPAGTHAFPQARPLAAARLCDPLMLSFEAP